MSLLKKAVGTFGFARMKARLFDSVSGSAIYSGFLCAYLCLSFAFANTAFSSHRSLMKHWVWDGELPKP